MSIYPTQHPGHAAEIAHEAADHGHHLVLAAGGDGTLGEVANGLAKTNTIMAPLPVGTANSFAKELQLPRPGLGRQHKLLAASDLLADGRVQAVDLGVAQAEGPPHPSGHLQQYWLLWAGTGVDGFLVDKLEPRPRWAKRLGAADYALRGIRVATHMPKMEAEIVVDGRTITGRFLLVAVSNCRLYAGGEVVLSPLAQMDDGRFEVWLFRGDGLARIFKYLAQVRLGWHLNHPDIEMVYGRDITIHTDPAMPCQTDGEKAGQTPLSCRLERGALNLLSPPTAPDGLFQRPGVPLLEFIKVESGRTKDKNPIQNLKSKIQNPGGK